MPDAFSVSIPKKKDYSARSVTGENYRDIIGRIKKCYFMEPKTYELIDHVSHTLDHYFHHVHGQPLRPETVHALVEDYLDRKYEKPDFNPPDGEAYLTNRLKYFDELHEAKFQQMEKKIVKKKFADLDAEEMKQVIQAMKKSLKALEKRGGIFTEPHLDAGIQLLEKLLDEKGPEATLAVVKWGENIIDKEGMVTSQDLEDDEPMPPEIDTEELRALFRKARPNLFNISTFLSTAAWTIGGTIVVLDSASSLGDKAYRAIERNFCSSESPDNGFAEFNHGLHATGVAGGGELIIGLALIYEGLHAWKHRKFDQISNIFAKTRKKEPFKTYTESVDEYSETPAKAAR